MFKHTSVNKFYLYTLFHSLVFAYVIERLFWASRGMRVIDVVYTEVIYSGVILLLELPTGMFADRFSRKKLIVADAVMACVEFIIIIYATQFWHFALAIALAGVGHALQSGAHNALLYDTLRHHGEEKNFEKILGRIKAVDYSGALVGGLIGAVIASRQSMVSTYWLSMVSLILALLISTTIKEVEPVEKAADAWGLKDWYAIFKFIFTQKTIAFIAIVGMATGAVTGFLDEFWQIYLEAVSIPVIYFGLFEVVAFGAVILGSIMAYKHKEKFGLRMTLTSMIFVSAISFVILAVFNQWYVILLIGLIYYAMSVIEPLIFGYLHDHAIEKYRATIESAFSFLEMFAVIVVGLPFGWIATRLSIFAGFIYLGAITAIVFLIVMFMGRRLEA